MPYGGATVVWECRVGGGADPVEHPVNGVAGRDQVSPQPVSHP